MATATTVPQDPVQETLPAPLPSESKDKSPLKNLTPLRKAAVLMITIGDELADRSIKIFRSRNCSC